MKKEEIMIDGKKEEIVIQLPDELKEDNILADSLEDTIDLEKILEITKEVKINE